MTWFDRLCDAFWAVAFLVSLTAIVGEGVFLLALFLWRSGQ